MRLFIILLITGVLIFVAESNDFDVLEPTWLSYSVIFILVSIVDTLVRAAFRAPDKW